MTEHEILELPPLLTVPPNDVQSRLLPEEWQACLELWISGLQLRLSLTDDQLARAPLETTTIPFVLSYFSAHKSKTVIKPGSTETQLNKHCYALLTRLLKIQKAQLSPSMYFELLSGGSEVYGHLASWKKCLKSLWNSQHTQARKAVESAKVSLATSSAPNGQMRWLQRISTLTRFLPETATVTVASADYIDALTDLFDSEEYYLARAVTANLFYSFIALLENKHITILTDNIYHMKSEADRRRKTTPEAITLLSNLLCTTSFLRHFASNSEVATRKQQLVNQLAIDRQEMLHLHPLPAKQRRNKSKERASKDEHMRMHTAAQLSQVHELFPDLSTGYILRALDYYSHNIESVIGALLEPDSLPQDLQDQRASDLNDSSNADMPDLAPRSTPLSLPERRNVFDDDPFERLNIRRNQLRRGKKDIASTEPTTGSEHTKSKAAIMSALAAFDSDDDERDDSYDVADVGGAVDNTIDSDERRQPHTDTNEGLLFKAWQERPELFARDSKTRASNIRQQLKRETNMGDEQIEGWAIVLQRDKRMQDRLQEKHSAARAFGGQQKALESTRWQATNSTDNSETESGAERSNDSRRMGQAGIRGHRDFGRGRGRGGIGASGPPDDASTQAARRRKEQGRGRGGANHRRDARAKKVGRGMGPMPPT